jgi:hypothetical protein
MMAADLVRLMAGFGGETGIAIFDRPPGVGDNERVGAVSDQICQPLHQFLVRLLGMRTFAVCRVSFHGRTSFFGRYCLRMLLYMFFYVNTCFFYKE